MLQYCGSRYTSIKHTHTFFIHALLLLCFAGHDVAVPSRCAIRYAFDASAVDDGAIVVAENAAALHHYHKDVVPLVALIDHMDDDL